MHRGNKRLRFITNVGNGKYICLAKERESAKSAGAGISIKDEEECRGF